MQPEEQAFYGEYAQALSQCQERLLTQIHELLNDSSANTPKAEHIACRIKCAASVQEKLIRHNKAPTPKQALTALSDVIGIRLVTRFIGDVYALAQGIAGYDGWKVIQTKDYIATPKPSGYRSYHMILSLPFSHRDFPYIRAELQLRTIAMDCWASLEHQMKYKKHIPDAALIGAELLRCADEMASTDLTMQAIREMIQAGTAREEEAHATTIRRG